MSNESRTAKTIRNVKVALLFYFLNLILQFFSRKVFLDCLGSEVLGLNTTAQNLLGFLNLAELGIGSAVAYNLYKPLFENDRNAINAIVSIQGWLYRRIAYIVIAGACILMCFFPMIFAKAQVPLWYAYGSFIVLLIAALLRAKELAAKGIEVFASPALRFFLYNDINRDIFYSRPECLENFIQLDDNDIWTSLKVWCNHPDKVLSTLSAGMVNRRLFKVEISSEPATEERKAELTRQISEMLGVTSEEATYFISTPGIEKNMYDPADDSIDIVYKDGTIKNIAEASDMLNISLLSKKVKKYYLCYIRAHK